MVPSSMPVTKPEMEVMGLRSSWDTLATNSRRLLSVWPSLSAIRLKAWASSTVSGAARSVGTRAVKSPSAMARAASVTSRRGLSTLRTYRKMLTAATSVPSAAISTTRHSQPQVSPSMFRAWV